MHTITKEENGVTILNLTRSNTLSALIANTNQEMKPSMKRWGMGEFQISAVIIQNSQKSKLLLMRNVIKSINSNGILLKIQKCNITDRTGITN